MQILVALITVLSSQIVFADRNSDAAKRAEELCVFQECRPTTTVRLKVDGTHLAEVSLPKAPFAYQEQVNIIPNETLYIEADDTKDGPKNLRYVKTLSHPEKTLVFKFEQKDSDKAKPFMSLEIKNPFSHVIKYKAGIHPAGRDRFYKTSVCPILGGKMVFESWPYPIFRVLMTNFRFVDEKDPSARKCEE